MILGIHHVAVSVPDIEKALDFYCNLLGFEVVQYGPLRPDPYVERVTQLPGCTAEAYLLKHHYGYLEVWEFQKPKPEPHDRDPVNRFGYTHFSLVVDDIHAEYERLKDHMDFPEGPVRHSVEGPLNNAWTMYGWDPFDNLIDFWQLGHNDPPLYGPEIEFKPKPLSRPIKRHD